MSLEIVKIEIVYNVLNTMLDYISIVDNVYLEKDVYLKYEDKLSESLFENNKGGIEIKKENGVLYKILKISKSDFVVSNSIDIITGCSTLENLPTEENKKYFIGLLTKDIICDYEVEELLASHNKVEKIFDSIMKTGCSKYVDKSFLEYTDKEIAITNMVSLRMIANKLQQINENKQ